MGRRGVCDLWLRELTLFISVKATVRADSPSFSRAMTSSSVLTYLEGKGEGRGGTQRR